MKRYYKLDQNGKILGSFLKNQPSIKGLLYLEEPTEDYQIWDGENWVDSPEKESILALGEITETDKDIVRVIDDILNYIINDVPIPQVAKDKLNQRKALREKL